MSSNRLPPQAIEAEQSLLGALMLDTSKWDDLSEMVEPADFYQPAHQSIFAAIQALLNEAHPADMVTVAEQLEKQGELDEVGGREYLLTLIDEAGDPFNAIAYAEIVRERSITRSLISTCSDIVDRAYDPSLADAGALLADAERSVLKIAESRQGDGGLVSIKEIAKKALQDIEAKFEAGDAVTGLPTGFDEMDKMTAGLQKGDLIIVAARPSMGKTAFSMNLVEAALHAEKDKPTVVFSLEMPSAQLAGRMLSSMGRIDAQKLRTGKLERDDFTKLTGAYKMLSSMNLHIDDTPGLGPNEMRARLRRLKREHNGVAMIMIDYLQLMQIKGFSEGRTGEISEISRNLKAIAREFDCPVIALSQLNRSVEQRPNKRPMNSDLRESGAIEQDADIIIFLYRDEYYNPDSPDKGTAEIILGKHRNGPVGSIRLAYLNQYTRFENLAPDYEYGAPAG
ncbi:replicative DNA helicase [Salinibius halmophilus]|uniref:replicative DNA helicase n=1 Tax=Salinibius halmophilus TaxID=1853216 RepID=UPI000E6741C4|nr:replicative DNA helicase [Salinibius halmophilus]